MTNIRKAFFFLLIMAAMPCAAHASGASMPRVGTDFVMLVGAANPVSSSYAPSKFAEVEGYRLHPRAAEAYRAMQAGLLGDQINNLRIQSAYRTYSHQTLLFNNQKAKYKAQGFDDETSAALAATAVAPPGASEHQTGLAIDVTVNGSLNRQFAETPAGQWIRENCHKYGFVVRYPENKTEITGIIYEPWHLRYVGLPHSSFMKENDMCLEEYIDYLENKKGYGFWEGETFYYKVDHMRELVLSGEADIIDVSADRSGFGSGFIVTKRYPARDPDAV